MKQSNLHKMLLAETAAQMAWNNLSTEERRVYAQVNAASHFVVAADEKPANPFHKVLTKHGFQHVSTSDKKNYMGNPAHGHYIDHVYKHPDHGKSHVVVSEHHANKTHPGDKPFDWIHRHEQKNGIMAPSSGDTKPQLDRNLTRHYGEPKA